MLNRRLIRIKVFKVLYAAEASQAASASGAEKELLLSCSKTLDLYYFLLNIVPALKKVAEAKIEAGKNKFNPTESDLTASTRFVDNRFIAMLEADGNFTEICRKKGLGWAEYDVFIKKLYASVVASDYYQEYMSTAEDSLEADCKFISRIYEEELEDNEMLWDILEETSVYWVDDLNYVLNVIIRDAAASASGGRLPAHEVFLKDDDCDFAKDLLRASLCNFDKYLKVVQESVPNWDPDRIVRTDAALVVMGIAEAVTFPSIPVKVTINEYVEISKYYSTPNSHTFVNGLLDVILRRMQESGEVVKQGRGLYEGK
ncbi:MAG: transcription antitermination protein NusB [Bacteroidales bacterium]|nr:transcription antitermination protein NusB [Bacteroidales bacterium]